MAEDRKDEDDYSASEEEKIQEWEDEESDSDSHSLQKGDFFGCYLLVSKNPQFKGRTYIGFTVNPKRRIRQHNAGRQKGGARRTSGRGPWEMVLIVHGFPNDVCALRFEWAWQHPAKSRRLGSKIGPGKRSKETSLEHRFRILSEMLVVGPWKRLPLTVRWLRQEHELDFPLDRQPPVHIPIAYGQVELIKKKSEVKKSEASKMEEAGGEEEEVSLSGSQLPCYYCHQERAAIPVAVCMLHCYHANCSLAAHATCLAKHMCISPHIIPTIVPCPACHKELLWGELVRSRTNHTALQTTGASVT